MKLLKFIDFIVSSIKSYWYLPGLIVFLISVFVAVVLWCVAGKNPYWQGVSVEAAGVVLEIILLVMLLGGYESWRKQQGEIDRLKQRIDDFKTLDTDYSHAVVASSMRQLANKEITAIDFRGCRLTNFSFDKNGIDSLKGSVFADGFWVSEKNWNKEQRFSFGAMKQVSFYKVDCSEVIFSSGNLSFASYQNCIFSNANLKEALFKGASLCWDLNRVCPDESGWYEVNETEEGQPYGCQIYLPAFDSANLDQTIFDECSFENADFRGAENILEASFKGAKGLDTCFFDDGNREKLKV